MVVVIDKDDVKGEYNGKGSFYWSLIKVMDGSLCEVENRRF